MSQVMPVTVLDLEALAAEVSGLLAVISDVLRLYADALEGPGTDRI
jgi:hypothetical protein